MDKEPIALIIAGSDSVGGAGVQADIKTMEAVGVYSASVITCVTAQNSVSVNGIFPITPEFVTAQLDAVFSDCEVAGVKTGMLYNHGIINAVADALHKHRNNFLVVDPVMVATSGDSLLEDGVVALYREKIFPIADLITPNLDEASILSGTKITSVAGMKEVAINIAEYGVDGVLIKGGHLNEGEEAIDLLYYKGEFHSFSNPFINNNGIGFHGTGCSLASAITAYLIKGKDLKTACQKGKEYVFKSIKKAFKIGDGNYVLNHRG